MSALPVIDAYEDPVRSPARPCRLSDPAPSQHLSFRRERDILSACSRPRLLAASSDRTDEPRCPTCCMPPPSALDAVSLRVLGLFFLWTNRSPVCGSFRHPCVVLCAPCILFWRVRASLASELLVLPLADPFPTSGGPLPRERRRAAEPRPERIAVPPNDATCSIGAGYAPRSVLLATRYARTPRGPVEIHASMRVVKKLCVAQPSRLTTLADDEVGPCQTPVFCDVYLSPSNPR